ncbi:MAG: ammonium transporter [Actinomycetota bacterium]|nr:ammonium transporter [Actinomycetota bacterium]
MTAQVRRFGPFMVAVLLCLVLSFVLSAASPAFADAGGESTGRGQDLSADLSQEVGHNKVALNFIWVFLGAILVFFMQAGFAMVETGFTQERNAVHVMMTNFTIFAIGTLGYFLAGYALMFGGVGALATLGGQEILNAKFEVARGWSLFGLKGFALSGRGVYDVGIFLFFLFQVVFMDTAATIVTGAMAERWKFKAFIVYGFFMSMILYPVFGHWVWGGGWLSQLGANLGLGHGFVDFAGSSVVHAVGGLCALAGALVIGPRIGKFDSEGKPRAIPGHNVPMAIIGVIILVFGWFGFNACSTLNGGDLRLAVVATNTLLAACAGCLSAMFFMWKKMGKPDPSMTANGMLAGLVAITAPCAFVPAWAALVIGTIAGILVCTGVFALERFGVDDPVGAVAVHGFNGIWGVLSLGLFADGTYGNGLNGVEGAVKGLFFGDAGQFAAQLVGAAACTVFVFGLSYLFFRLQDRWHGIRVSPQEEVDGLDVHEMGINAYTEDSRLVLPISPVPAADMGEARVGGR